MMPMAALADLVKLDRELKALDALEARINRTVNPSAILLRQIADKRQQLLNPQEPQNAQTPRK